MQLMTPKNEFTLWYDRITEEGDYYVCKCGHKTKFGVSHLQKGKAVKNMIRHLEKETGERFSWVNLRYLQDSSLRNYVIGKITQ